MPLNRLCEFQTSQGTPRHAGAGWFVICKPEEKTVNAKPGWC